MTCGDSNKGMTKGLQLPSETYSRSLRQFDEWLTANGYPTAVESSFADLGFRNRSRRLLYLIKYVEAVFDSEKQ